MKEDVVVCYMHAGSGNHGCEAIVNATCNLLKHPVRLVSNRPWEDRRYTPGSLCEVVAWKSVTGNRFRHAILLAKRLVLRDPDAYARFQYQEIIEPNSYKTCLSIGGDNYCYEDMLAEVMSVNRLLKKQGSRIVLWGCSIEPDLLNRMDVVEDLKGYELILARESLTYEALCTAGLHQNSILCPDPAFTLSTAQVHYPADFGKKGIVGINLSPLIMKSETVKGITIQNYKELIQYILKNTEYAVALIPHVVWENNDDRQSMEALYKEIMLEQDYSDRVIMIQDCNCMELKGYIAACRFFVGARTHATIAAYSTGVPTLVVGYSVKARGIAKDLFETEEHYVLPVQSLKRSDDLKKEFLWLMENETQIREQLESVMPDYKKRAAEAAVHLTERVQ
ncbi:MAG: polysaccharide pyruvyl transferase family protein [Lachnospiraceae bacterium]|nr:polysaccharide pyruvyl transferase family protein [Lachnospiraceae bacterium]